MFYDSVLREVDESLRSFLSDLDDREGTIVVVTSDHGEEFWEYGQFEREHFEDPRGIAGVGHRHALVPPVLEVPILSDSVSIAQSDGPASTVDIVPTILRELGVDHPDGLDGVPL
ncbi:sulfatase-like hydrolase/transferase [Halosimplex halobium]|uniref:sulfatase-like hydrolase/transferase n=1 Tax=Halosimplex halobium TaxID=3396618 RepID=UPI003F54C12B